MHFLSRFFEKSRKCDAELFAKSKKSEKREKNSEIVHAQNQLSANGSGGGRQMRFFMIFMIFLTKAFLIHFFALFLLNFSQKHRQGTFLCHFQPKAYSTIFFSKKHFSSLGLPLTFFQI